MKTLNHQMLNHSLNANVSSSCSKAGIGEIFEGHQGPVTGINCHMAVGPIDFSHLFVTSSFDWTVKLWTTKVRNPTWHGMGSATCENAIVRNMSALSISSPKYPLSERLCLE